MDKETFLNIPRPQKTCANCGAMIDTLGRHPSVIRLVRKEEAQRHDYCPACWDYLKQEVWDSFWITHREPPEHKAVRLSRRERAVALRALFESLWERRETEDVGPHIYLLAHLLMKWGGLRWKENLQAPGGGEIVVFEEPASGDRLEVQSVELTDERLAMVKEEIEQFLRHYAPEDEDLSL